jgi:hypothetical protein
VFWSRDYGGESGGGGVDRLGGEHSSSSSSNHRMGPGGMNHRDLEQWAEGGDNVRPNARALSAALVDGGMGNSAPASAFARGQASAAGAGMSGAGGTAQGNGVRRVPSPGLEFGTVRRTSNNPFGTTLDHQGHGARGPWGATYDSGASRRPHLVIEGAKCGKFPDHAVLDADC